MCAVTLSIFLAGIGISLAALDDDCTKFDNQWWNGTQCVGCSGCPRGFGVKSTCSSKQNTECQPCYPGYDYSNTTGFEPCILCDQYSNCLEGKAKKIKNCTIFSPHICEGCADGYFFDPGKGMKGGCCKCSSPCAIFEDETMPCSTEHDRKCTAKWKKPIILVLSTPSTVNGSKEIPSTTSSTVEKGDQGSDESDYSPELNESPLVKRPWFWIVLVVAAGLPATVIGLIKCHKRPPKNRNNGVICNVDVNVPMIPRGLDRPIKDLTFDGKKFISRMLNGKGNYSYFYWQMTAEKLDLVEECKTWEGAENPTEKLLTAYGEREGSTIRNLIAALREVELSHFANEIEQKFSIGRDQGARGSALTTDTEV